MPDRRPRMLIFWEAVWVVGGLLKRKVENGCNKWYWSRIGVFRVVVNHNLLQTRYNQFNFAKAITPSTSFLRNIRWLSKMRL